MPSYSIQCPICTENRPIQNDDPNVFSTNCGHLYCESCIKQYIRTQNLTGCPICHKHIVFDELHKIFLSDFTEHHVKCPICWDRKAFDESDGEIYSIRCGHLFCGSCIQRHHRNLSETSSQCPVCKAGIRQYDLHRVFLFGIIMSTEDVSSFGPGLSTATNMKSQISQIEANFNRLTIHRAKWIYVPDFGCSLPIDAFIGGRDILGEPLYVARVHHRGDLLPAKLNMSHRKCYAPYDCKENNFSSCEILAGNNFQWIRSSNGNVPEIAVKVGRTANGEHLYSARVDHCNSKQLGKVHPSHGCAYISYDGKEIFFKNYEVLAEI